MRKLHGAGHGIRFTCAPEMLRGVRGEGLQVRFPGGAEAGRRDAIATQEQEENGMSLIQTAITGHPEYPKIETLFERGPDFKVTEKLKSPVIGTISAWDVTEKIDGTNIRVMLSETGDVCFGGRSQAAQLPADLLMYLGKTFQSDALQATFWIDGKPTSAVLYGEGYGAGIQKGSAYRPDKAFILFDVLVGGKWWLDREAVDDVAVKLGIDVVPYLGCMGLLQIVEKVKTPFASKIGSGLAEGIVARPIEPLFDRKGSRIIIKLKTKDFVAGKR
jgi:hypothetical protein